MLQIERDKSYVVFSEAFLNGFNLSVIPNASILRTTELCRVLEEVNVKTSFFDKKIDSVKLQFLNGGDCIFVPTIYQSLGRFNVVSGRKLIPSEEDKHIFDNIDFEKEFVFSF